MDCETDEYSDEEYSNEGQINVQQVYSYLLHDNIGGSPRRVASDDEDDFNP